MMGRGRLLPLDFDDLIRLGAARRDDLDLDALLLADQRPRERRSNGDLALLGVRFGFADDLPHRLLVGILVDQRDGRAECDRVAGKLRYVNDFGARELVLELGDAALVERLRLLRRVVLGVLREIAMGPRVGDLLDDAGPFDLLAVLEFSLKRRMALRGHRNLIHRFPTSIPAGLETKFQSRAEALPGHATLSLSLYVPSLWLFQFWIRGGRKIILQRTHFEVAPEVGLDTLRCGDGPRESGVVRHFMQEGSAA